MTDNDCYHRALPDEPKFTLLARDPTFAMFLNAWAGQREMDVQCGARPQSDMELVMEARILGARGAKWRKENDGKWRQP